MLKRDDESLTKSFFARKQDYKAVLNEALKKEDQFVIEGLNKYLPLERWFDKNEVYESFRETFSDFINSANNFTWCMTFPNVRKCFTPDEKAHFVSIGFALRNHEMAYYGTLDNDHPCRVNPNGLVVELMRLGSNRVNYFNDRHLQPSYFKWIKEKILVNHDDENKYSFLLGILHIGVGNLRVLSEIKALTEIGYGSNGISFEKVCKVESDIKQVIHEIKSDLYFDYWNEEFKAEIVKYSIELAPTVNNLTEKDKLMEFATKLIPMIAYIKMDNELKFKEGNSPKKVKL